jgi:hypothetical protein
VDGQELVVPEELLDALQVESEAVGGLGNGEPLAHQCVGLSVDLDFGNGVRHASLLTIFGTF